MLEIANNKMTSHARHRSSEFRFKRLGPHIMSALQVWLMLLLFVFQNDLRISVSAQPGYLDFDNLPDTNFSCVGKVIGGYYADLETSCQMFHVCTIGQQEEAMDIKFLCLNGTVFDQETRVCERVDEVDCSKSERFYNLNLELYGNTAPPVIEPEQASKPIEPVEENAEEDDEQYEEDEVDYSEPSSTTMRPQTTTTIPTTQTTTQPTTTTHYTTTQYTTTHYRSTTNYKDETTTKLEENSDDYTLSDNKDLDHDIVKQKFATVQKYGTVTDRNNENVSPTYSPGVKPQLNPGYGPPAHDTRPDTSPQYQVHKIISPQEFIYQHSPQSNQGNKNEAISFQQQTFSNNGQNSHITVTSHNVDHKSHNDNKPNANSLAEKIYITSSTPRTGNRYSEVEQIDKYELYESSKNIPLINMNKPPTVSPILSPPKQQDGIFQFSLKNPSRIPQGFKLNPTTQNPHSQLLSPNSKNNLQNTNQFGTSRPIQSYQPSEHHEILFENRFQLPTEIPLAHDYNQYHFERKRSHDAQQPLLQANEQIVPRSVPKTTTEPNHWVPHRNSPKSPPRVIVTASASVSDSNGKKLNYTVGNVVHAVKPIVPVNYDNFKEEDVIVDPFFLDVPKLIKKRSERHASGARRIKRTAVINSSIHLNGTQKIKENVTQEIEDTPIVVETTTMRVELAKNTSSTTVANTKPSSILFETTTKWSPPDYVDDNYEPNVYQEPKSNDSFTSEIQKDETNSTDAITSTTPSSGTKSPSASQNLEKVKHNYIKEYLKKLTEFHKIVKENSEKYLQLNLELEKSRQLNKVAIVTTKPIYEVNKFSHLEKPSTVKNTANLVDTLNRLGVLKQTTLKPVLTTIHSGIKYTLVTITTSLNLDTSETKNVFTCSGKDYHRFYPDLTNCRNFHLCTPGYNKYQVLDMVFECDSNLIFNYKTLECSNDKPNNCYFN